ncbi:MAG: hypothetical protein CMO74_11930 [Verrucomicrobiales bacterium]|nr:hypothetical protein [Verrucomicrobiales bacterium]|tara:strand:- start:301 stop:501 length:201 start_codon:yes stop_codon:yes gene_type:complete
MNDEIVNEVRANREALLQEHGGRLDALTQAAMKRQWEHDRKVLTPEPKPIQPDSAPNAYVLREQTE